MQSRAKTVDEYLAEVPPERAIALSALRKLIKQVVPAAKEGMAYGMPGYSLNGILFGMASQKNYMAFYCCDEVVDTYRPALGSLNCGKGCIRFRKLEELPLDVIAAILRDVGKLRLIDGK